MKIFKINSNIEVHCQTWERKGWGHEGTLYAGDKSQKVSIRYYNRTWEKYQFESVLEKLADENEILSPYQLRKFKKFIKDGGRVEDDLKPLKTVAMVAKMGEIFCNTQKAKNDWKTRMLKAGLENKGLIMPDNWGSLGEDEKERRLNGAIGQLSI